MRPEHGMTTWKRDALGTGRAAAAGVLLATLLVAAGCSSTPTTRETATTTSYRYAPNAVMTGVLAETAARDIAIRCPAGWMETVDARNAPSIVLWIVEENYRASISFVPLQMDPVLYKTLRKDGLPSIAKISLSLKRANAHDSVRVLQQPETFLLNGREYIAYEYSADGGNTTVRVVVFDTGKQYMECALLPATTPVSSDENRRLFSVQQSVLASMVVK